MQTVIIPENKNVEKRKAGKFSIAKRKTWSKQLEATDLQHLLFLKELITTRKAIHYVSTDTIHWKNIYKQ